jgi:hypothetical protein
MIPDMTRASLVISVSSTSTLRAALTPGNEGNISCHACVRTGMKSWLPVSVAFLATLNPIPSLCQSPQEQPTKEEIAAAYRSKSGESDLLIVPFRWERWRVRQVRGWSLHFKRVKESRRVGVLTLEYHVTAKKGGSCAAYQITDTMPLGPNSQIRPILVVEPDQTVACK